MDNCVFKLVRLSQGIENGKKIKFPKIKIAAWQNIYFKKTLAFFKVSQLGDFPNTPFN